MLLVRIGFLTVVVFTHRVTGQQNSSSTTPSQQPRRTLLFPVSEEREKSISTLPSKKQISSTKDLDAKQPQNTLLIPVRDEDVKTITTTPSPKKHTPSAEELEAAKNARYYFSSDVEDQTKDLTQHRDELRDGLKVKGSYSYSDGFLSRKVVYEADENGHRVISDMITPLQGLTRRPNGTTTVRSEADGEVYNYTLNSIPGKETRDNIT